MPELRRVRDEFDCPHCGQHIEREIGIMTDQSLRDEIVRLRDLLGWVLLNTSGSELRRMVGELSDTSNLDEFISAIDRARS